MLIVLFIVSILYILLISLFLRKLKVIDASLRYGFFLINTTRA